MTAPSTAEPHPAADHGLHVTRRGRVATVLIDRPPVNALTFAAYDGIAECFQALSKDPELSVVVLTGAGERAFVAGHDVREFVDLGPEKAERDLARVRRAFDAVQDCTIPVVAALNGPAIGAGLALASLCDVRVASTEMFFSLPEIDVGVIGSASHVMRLVPQGTTRLMALTGRRLPAAEALRLGMVEQVVAPADVLGAALAIAEEMAAKSPAALRLVKGALDRLEALDVKAGYELECRLTSEVRRGRDAAEGARSFVEKRRPDYEGLQGGVQR